jgi:multiple sugar transport system ATP-binding protein
MAGVTLRNLQKSFTDPVSKKNVKAVDDLNLQINDGEFLVLVGPSGCGKTTALRMIAGLEEPTGGEILIGTRTVNDVPPRDRNIAMVFQSYALYPHMSVYDNMAFGLRLRRLPGKIQQLLQGAKTAQIKAEIDSKVTDTAKMLGLTDYLQRKPKQLSGGQRQRVALGRAIVREPQVFLMDEPLSNLDAKLRVQTRADLIKLHRQLGITTVYVTHDQVEAMTMGQRIAVMKDGVLQQCDTPLTLYHSPANMFVAGFLGTPGMNFVTGARVTKSETGYGVDAGDFRVQLSSERIGERLSPYVGAEVVVGIRPQSLYPTSAAPASVAAQGNKMRATVEVIEPMGAVSTVFLQLDRVSLVAEMDADAAPTEGQTFDMLLDAAAIHLFDPSTEKALL